MSEKAKDVNPVARTKRWLAGVGAGLFLMGAARADAIPEGIKAWFAPIQTRAMVLEDGVLRVAMKKPVVSTELFDFQVKSLCQAPLVGQRYEWGNARIERIEILNDSGQQGYALMGGRKACSRLNGMGDAEGAAFLAQVRREVRAGRVQE